MENNELNENEFFGEETVRVDVERLWGEVIEAAAKFTRDAKKFGFETIGYIPNPSIHQMLVTLKVIDSLLDVAISESDGLKLDSNDVRLIFNAKQQILNMKRVATALNNKDKDSYDEAVRLMNNQAPI